MTGEQGSLRSVVARGAAMTVTGQVARIVLQLVGLVVLARLLSPEEYGILAMVLAVFGIGEILRDFGLGSAMVQAKEVTKAQRTNLFWLTTSLGGALSLAAFLCAPLLPRIYDNDDVVGVAQFLAVSFLINGATSTHRADLTRSLRFGWLVVADVASQAAGIVAGVTAALLGAGTGALVWMLLTQAMVGLIVCVGACGWLPGLPRRATSIRGFLNFGVGVTASQVLAYGAKNADAILVGALLGPHQLGLYSRAMQLLFLPIGQLQPPATRIALPILSRVSDDPPEFDRRLLRAQAILMHFIALVVAIGAALAPPLVVLALGDQWTESASILRLLSLGGFAFAASYSAYWVFLARALTGPLFTFSLWARPLTIASLCAGAVWGVEGVAIAFSLNALVNWPLNYWWISRHIALPIRALVGNGLRVMLTYGSAAVVAGFVVDQVAASGVGIAGQIVVGAAAVGVVTGVGLMAHPNSRSECREIFSFALAMKASRR